MRLQGSRATPCADGSRGSLFIRMYAASLAPSGSAARFVAERLVAEQGRVLTVDEAAITTEIHERTATLHKELAVTAAAAKRLEPYYAAMYRRVAATDVGFSRWLSAQ